MSKELTYTFCVPENKCGFRLDKFLTSACQEFSRTRIKALITGGHVISEGNIELSPAMKVKAGDYYTVILPQVLAAIPQPENIPLDIMFEDDHIIVLNKQSGLVVHPGAGNYNGTLVNALLNYCGATLSGIGGVARPGIVHRLDKDTSGIMVVAKTDQAHRHLSEQFSDHSIKRAYLALVWGVPKEKEGSLQTYIGRSPSDRKKMKSLSKGGKKAITIYRIEESFGSIASLLKCTLFTGRTHQIRVHMSEIGHSIINDPIYGKVKLQHIKNINKLVSEDTYPLKFQALQAFFLGFKHPYTNDLVQFEVDIRQDMDQFCKALRLVNDKL